MPGTTETRNREKYPGMVDPKPPTAIERILLRGGGVLVAIVAVMYVFYAADFGFLRDEITKYAVYCNTPSGELSCNDSQLVRMPPVTFKVFVDQQAVIETAGNEAPQRLKNCAVINRTNWKCEQFPGRDFGFQDGRYWEIAPSATLNARFVSRYQWLQTHDPPKP